MADRCERGPLDILKETLDGPQEQQPTSVLSFILQMREKIERATKLVHDNPNTREADPGDERGS